MTPEETAIANAAKKLVKELGLNTVQIFATKNAIGSNPIQKIEAHSGNIMIRRLQVGIWMDATKNREEV